MMSGQMKVKSLSLSRKTQTPPRKEESRIIIEDDESYASNIEAALNSPISRASRLCSTPNDKNVADIPEDSPDQDLHYRCSPTSMFPCTQDSNEIAWDWNSGINKLGTSSSFSNCDKLNNKNNSSSLNNTPKRPKHNFHKKRTAKAYSPLLNMPNKRKQRNLNVAESIGKFAEELKALADIMKTSENQETNERKNENEDHLEATDSKDSEIYNMQTQKVFDIHEASTMEFSFNVEEEKTDPEKIDSSLEDLFDDDVDDACMVQCSQEIENKLKFNSDINRTKSVINLSNEDEKTVVNGERKIGSGISKTLSDSNIGAKSSGTKSIETRFDRKKIEEKGESSSSSTCLNSKFEKDKLDKKKLNGIPESEIADDSIDDSLALCFDDDEWIENFLEDKDMVEINTPEKSNSDSSITNKLNPAIKIGKDDKAASSSSNLKRKQQCFNTENSIASTSSESRKYLKSKSLSDSYCGNDKNDKTNLTTNGNTNLGEGNYSPPIKKSTSNFNLSTNMKSKMNGIENEVASTINLNKLFPAAGSRNNNNTNTNNNNNNSLTMKQQNSNTKVSYSHLRTSNENLGMNRSSNIVDPYSKRVETVTPLRTTVPTMSQQLLYKPEEIENKRLEAKKKLEASRLKKQISSMNLKSNTGAVDNNSMQSKRPLIKR